jgi:Fe2+ or Zn2+ uptake regulation protein
MTAEVADETGFDILAYRLDFFGICDDCKREENRLKPKKKEI